MQSPAFPGVVGNPAELSLLLLALSIFNYSILFQVYVDKIVEK